MPADLAHRSDETGPRDLLEPGEERHLTSQKNEWRNENRRIKRL